MRWVLLFLTLSACGATAPDRPAARGATGPAAVTLYRDNVVVEMRDGAVCTGVREGRSGPWSATLRGCPYGWPVSVLRPTSRPRVPLVPGSGDPWVTLSPPEAPALGFGPRAGT